MNVTIFPFDASAEATQRKKVVIIGSGPNRIGQGIEFDYCCVQAVFSLRGHNKLQPGDGEHGQGNGR